MRACPPLLLALCAACDGGGGTAIDADPAPIDGDGVDLDAGVDADPTVDPLEGIGAVELVDGDYQFLEGPQWIAATGTLRFTDIPADTIYELAGSEVTVYRMPSGNANGLGLLPDGRMLAAEHGPRRVSVDGELLVERFEGARLNSPNDLVARDDGTVYFTDPPYGIDDAQRELDFIGVFRVPPGATEPIVEWEGALDARPNGIALAPDAQTLYVADTTGVLRAYDVATDGSLSGERVLSTDVPGADGMAVDRAGNLFVTTSAGVRVLSADGAVWGTIPVDEQPANCAFGDADARTLYITARTSLYRVRLASPGLPTR